MHYSRPIAVAEAATESPVTHHEARWVAAGTLPLPSHWPSRQRALGAERLSSPLAAQPLRSVEPPAPPVPPTLVISQTVSRPLPPQADVVSSQGVTIDRIRHRATAGQTHLEVTRSEFRLLDTLVREPGRVFTREELIDSALGTDAAVLLRTIDVHIRALRRKLGDHATTIETVRGVGYRFRETEPRDGVA